MQNIFFDIGIIIIIASIFGYLAKLLKQPPILAYLLTGILIGPTGFGWIMDQNTILILSELGIAFLLFIVGLEFDLKKLKEVSMVSGVAAIVQIMVCFIAGYFLAAAFGFTQIHSIYLALALAFSSTMIAVKLLSDKNELNTIHGKIILVVLLIQDIIAIFALSFLSTIEAISLPLVAQAFFNVGLLFLITVVSSKFILPHIFKTMAQSTELLVLSSIGLLFLFSIIAHLSGFSIAIGAFLAGLSLAGMPYSLEIIGRIKALTSFFSTIFFASLGMQFVFGDISSFILPIISFSLLVMIINPLSVMIPVSMFGYKKRSSFLSGIAIGQTSEFSLIIVSLGLVLGHITQEIVSIVVFVTALTIMTTTYAIKYDESIYRILSGPLSVLDKLNKNKKKIGYIFSKSKHEIVLCGYNRLGYSVLKTMEKMKKKILVVDFNPGTIKKMMEKKINCIYGDIGDPEIINKIGLKNTKIIISTVPGLQESFFLIKKAREANNNILIFVTASQIEDALQLYSAGADYVILPHFLGGEYVSFLIEQSHKKNKLMRTKFEHIHELGERQRIGHEHPYHQ